MTRVLLLGAGFSKNWGGLLAKGVFGYLLGHATIRNEATLSDLLKKYEATGEGFEGAFTELQTALAQSANDRAAATLLATLENAVLEMFGEMNASFAQQDFRMRLRQYLAGFDAIFTLNQDLLMEHAYMRHDGLIRVWEKRWEGVDVVGMKPTRSNTASGPDHPGSGPMVPRERPATEPRYQPFIKLHGSSNWRDASGRNILIMGGRKEQQISSYPLTKFFSEEFGRFLSLPATRVVIIGYGYNDPHINRALLAAENASLMVVDPTGLDAIRGPNWRNAVGGGNTSRPLALQDRVRDVWDGDNLRECFNNDGMDLNRFTRYLQ